MITVTLRRSWQLLDGAKPAPPASPHVHVGPGVFQLERVKCPYRHPCNWLVLVGTLVGMAEGAWRQWSGPEWGNWEITIEEA